VVGPDSGRNHIRNIATAPPAALAVLAGLCLAPLTDVGPLGPPALLVVVGFVAPGVGLVLAEFA